MLANELKIDPELRDLLPPLTKEEYKKLEDSLINEGFHNHEYIEIWCTPDDERYIIDGHNRYKICKDNNIEINPWNIVTVGYWDTKDEAKHWMLIKQLGRRNLTPIQRMALVEKYKEIIQEKAKENLSNGGKGLSTLTKVNTRQELSKISGVSEGTIAKYDFVMKSDNELVKSKMINEELSINRAYNILKDNTTNQSSLEINESEVVEINVNCLKPLPAHDKYFENITGDDWIDFLKSVKENGVIESILVSQEMTIISGHQRVRACKDLGIETIPCRFKKYMTDDQQIDYQLMLKDCLVSNLKLRSTDFDIAYKALKENGWI